MPFFNSDRSLIAITAADPIITHVQTISVIPNIFSFDLTFSVQITNKYVNRYKHSYDLFITFMKNKKSLPINLQKLDI